MKRLVNLCAMAVCLCACSVTVPLTGQVQNASETFTGTTTGRMDGSGTVTAVTSNGASCTGNFVYVTARAGEGVFRCNDGRSGPFKFASAGTHGNGQGTLGGQAFTFTFGQ
jgi:hypothetical protein